MVSYGAYQDEIKQVHCTYTYYQFKCQGTHEFILLFTGSMFLLQVIMYLDFISANQMAMHGWQWKVLSRLFYNCTSNALIHADTTHEKSYWVMNVNSVHCRVLMDVMIPDILAGLLLALRLL